MHVGRTSTFFGMGLLSTGSDNVIDHNYIQSLVFTRDNDNRQNLIPQLSGKEMNNHGYAWQNHLSRTKQQQEPTTLMKSLGTSGALLQAPVPLRWLRWKRVITIPAIILCTPEVCIFFTIQMVVQICNVSLMIIKKCVVYSCGPLSR